MATSLGDLTRGLRASFDLLLIAVVLVACAGTSEMQASGDFHGASSDFTWLAEPRRPDPVAFRTPGQPLPLRAFEGRLVVLNFWATWCAPCRNELPSLNRLQASMGDQGLKVVAVAMDRAGITAAVAFHDRLGLNNLDVYADPKEQAGYFRARPGARGRFPLYGLPITYIVAPDGRTLGYLTGPADWGSPAAKRFLRQFLPERKPT